jgi:capsular polysaccharide transport system ATP-binding protein
MKARLAFGLSLAIDFDCYLIDEITAVGDRRFKTKSADALNEKIKDARVLMISHSEKTIRDYCQMGVLLYNAKLYYYTSVEDLIKDYRRFC